MGGLRLRRAAYLALFVLMVSECRTQYVSDNTPAVSSSGGQTRTSCYDEFRRPKRCIPPFENAAYNVRMTATNTCAEDSRPLRYCMQTDNLQGMQNKSCAYCFPEQHSAQYLTDFHSRDNMSWWQSETMYEGIQYPAQVNLTLNLGKAFDITYVRIWFYSPRPESFSIYKRTSEDGPWLPYQFYSSTCRDTYSLPEARSAKRGEETQALCTSEYSDISPLQHGNVAFSTLEGRPSAYSFDASQELQEWVTATDIQITLDRLNAFGDQVFGEPEVLRTYYYAVADIAVGARCKCNGHASECITSTGLEGSVGRVCKCEHNTAGPDCNTCLPFYNDAPWGRASERNANECKQCNCNGYSNRCFFDRDLYTRTGHGGHCLDCTANRDGPNCERCQPNYYTLSSPSSAEESQHCVACQCDPVGSRSLQCNTAGRCQCRDGVTGDKCDRCDVNHYEFSRTGCKGCGCSEPGSVGNSPVCDAVTGTCHCKENVEGKRCRDCKPGYFNLDLDNKFGCSPCFCYGHSSECVSAPGYSRYQHESVFARNTERWSSSPSSSSPSPSSSSSSLVTYHVQSQSISVTASGDEPVFFLAPDRYLGDQRSSYNQLLQFSLRIGESAPVPRATDVTLEGAGAYITNTIFAQRNPYPNTESQVYTFRLHEHPDYGWQPRLPARAFMTILTNLTAIKIRGTYTRKGIGYLDDVKLETASRGVAGKSAQWIEQCECPKGYVGQFCESCAPGFRHSPSLGGPFKPCIPCDCNGHADICDSETGRCICQHNTTGDNCEICSRGYYGNALGATPSDCSPCGCPNGGACIQLDEDIVMCVECPLGYTGHRCDSCSDGFYGDPTGRSTGVNAPCVPCECNLNIDPNAIGNCNTTTGECLKCVDNTGGERCDRCLTGYYGDALALPKGDCRACQCHPVGTSPSHEDSRSASCDQITGTCHCRAHVVGRNCDECEVGHYNLASGEGCRSCECDAVGAVNGTCDVYTGQCVCRPGVTGLRCGQCDPYKHSFSLTGCTACECDPIGSRGLQCDSTTGQCPCLDNVEGERCDRCKENKYDRQRGCVDCPDCYNLVVAASGAHRDRLAHLGEVIDEIERSPTVVDDNWFEEELQRVDEELRGLLKQARLGTGGGDDKTVLERLGEIEKRQQEVGLTLDEIEDHIYLAKDVAILSLENITYTSNVIKSAEDDLNDSEELLKTECVTLLAQTRELAREFGQQSDRMTEIAQESRVLADRLQEYSEEVQETAEEAKAKSNQSYELAKATADRQKNISLEIRTIQHDLKATAASLAAVSNQTTTSHTTATANKNRALTLLNDANNLALPDINLALYREDGEQAKLEAGRLINATEQLLENNYELSKEIDQQLVDARDLLESVADYQDNAANLLGDIDFARAQAENAVQLGDKTLNDARATHETLSHFDKQVKESKAAAQQALNTIPEIQRLITDSADTADRAQDTLAAAQTNAKTALEKAHAANELAADAAQRATKIRDTVQRLRLNGSSLSKEASFMAERVESTESEFGRFVEQTRSNGTLIAEAKDKVGRAGTETTEAWNKVTGIMLDIREITRELESLPGLVDEKELDRLEAQLLQAEQKMKAAQLDELLELWQREQREQAVLIESYTEEVRRLTAEVEGVEAIAKALPEGCYKRVTLEP